VPLDETAAAALTKATGAPVCEGMTNFGTGLLVAASLPNPPLSTRTAEPQTGHVSGSPGRILPGLSPEDLPGGWVVEESGYVRKAQ
jgi:hypothetical protein